MHTRLVVLACVAVTAVALAACGGGGGSPSNDDVKADYEPVRTDLLGLGNQVAGTIQAAKNESDEQLASQFQNYSNQLADIHDRLDAIETNDATESEMDALATDVETLKGDTDDIVTAANNHDPSAAFTAARKLVQDSVKLKSDREALDKTLGVTG